MIPPKEELVFLEPTKSDEPACPECEKLRKIAHLSQVCGEFLEWLRGDRGLVLAFWDKWGPGDQELSLTNISSEKLLAEFFKIDLDKIEAERRAMLDYLRAKAEGR